MAKVETERKGSSFVVTINRPEVHNCIDGETAGLLYQAIDIFSMDENLAVLILTGAGGRSFCSGADLKNAGSLLERPGVEETGPVGISRIIGVSKPTVAAIDGYCLAGGLELACWCDFRIASSSSCFGDPARRWGVPLIDGGTQRLPRIVGLGNALYLIETGIVIDADDALRMGLVQELIPDGKVVSRALELAEVMSTYPQICLRNDRRATYEGLTLSLKDGLALEAKVHRSSLEAPEMRERLRQYAIGQRPSFPRSRTRS